jgi:hypothetical protein
VKRLSLSAGLFVVLVSQSAVAQDKQECITASENAQRLRDQHKLSKAREQFLVCARDICPPAIKQDCTEQATKLAEKMPSIVVRAKSKAVANAIDVTVSLDGSVITQKLDGTPVQIDPGVHMLKLEAAGETPIEKQVVIAEGEQNRVLDFSFGGASEGGGSPAPAHKRGFPIVPTIVAGVGVVAFGMFATFGLMGTGEFNDAKKGCAPNCTNSMVDPIRTKLIVADVSLAIGIASAIGATVLYILHFSGGSSEKATALRSFGAAPIPGGAYGSFGYKF